MSCKYIFSNGFKKGKSCDIKPRKGDFCSKHKIFGNKIMDKDNTNTDNKKSTNDTESKDINKDNIKTPTNYTESKDITKDNIKIPTNDNTRSKKTPNNDNKLSEIIEKIYNIIQNKSDSRIILLRDKNILKWLFGDLSFIKKSKNEEDIWGRNVLKIRRKDLKLDKQWTNKFGEHICEEIFYLLEKNISIPKKKKHFQPDLENDEYIIEVKTGTYYTTGTASEKILGTPLKYCEIPELYNKKLQIICVGGAEKICREKFCILGNCKKNSKIKQFLDFYKQHNIEYVAMTDMLKNLVI